MSNHVYQSLLILELMFQETSKTCKYLVVLKIMVFTMVIGDHFKFQLLLYDQDSELLTLHVKLEASN